MKDDYTLSIPPNSLIYFFFKGWENVLFELLGVNGLLEMREKRQRPHSKIWLDGLRFF